MFKKLFESLDEKVFTPELKETLEAQFNEAVEAKATEIADSKINEKIEELNQKSEEHIELLNEKAEEFVELKRQELVESLDKYLDRIVDEFLIESEEKLTESAKSEKADMLIEAFESMIISHGVEVAKIVEAKNTDSVETKLTETVKKYDSLVEENISLKEENDKLIKLGVIAETSADLSIVECEKFKKLADLVEFTKDEEFVKKLEVIKESVKGTKESNQEDTEVNEDTKPEWAHLV